MKWKCIKNNQKKKVTMKSEVGEEILYEMKTELQVFIFITAI